LDPSQTLSLINAFARLLYYHSNFNFTTSIEAFLNMQIFSLQATDIKKFRQRTFTLPITAVEKQRILTL
jgi:hypothetical protein